MTELIDAARGRAPAHARKERGKATILRDRSGRMRTKDPRADRAIRLFLLGFLAMGIAAIYVLQLDGAQLLRGIRRIPEAIGKLAEIDFYQFDITMSSLLESISVTILSTVYSLVGGMFLALFLAKNLTPFLWLSAILSAIMTFLRAIPSIIWVLLVLVCVGFGPVAGIIGICIFSTSFFARSFAQCFEEVSADTIEALRAMGAGQLKIFFSAVLPSAMTAVLAWTSLSFERNFEASAVLGTVGAGGIGYVISNSFGRYAYGQALVAIGVVLVFTYALELSFTFIKEKKAK